MTTPLIFAYGTLRTGCANHSRFRRWGVPIIGRQFALLHDHQLRFLGGRAVPYIREMPGEQVLGEVFRFDQEAFDFVLDCLDQVEGHPGFYYRQPMPVEYLNMEPASDARGFAVPDAPQVRRRTGVIEEVFTYTMPHYNRDDGGAVPHNDFSRRDDG